LESPKRKAVEVDGYEEWGAKGKVTMQNRATRKRSIVKAVTYRGIIVCLDFLVVYLLTGKVMTAAAFMIVSNIYTTVAYFLHERVWAGIKWGMEPQKET
jgi:uncharacterized membrane protein